MTSAPPIGFEYRGSRLLMLALVVVAALAMTAVLNTDLSNFARQILIIAVAATSGASFARLLRPRVQTVLWRSDGGVQLTLRDTVLDSRREVGAELRAANVLGPLITLKLRWPGRGRATVWLLPDNLDADTRRRLRVRLRAG